METSLATSPTLGELAKALAAAQGQIQSAKKSAQNPHFRTRYADLASIWDACRGPLSAHGLCVVQTTDPQGRDGVMVTTSLLHASGEWIRSSLYVPVSKADAQGFGSALTYARRYSLAAMVGVAPDDDDDAEQATGRQPQREPVRQAPPPPPSEPAEETDWAAFEQQATAALAVVTSTETLAAIAAGVSKRSPPKKVRDAIAKAYREAQARIEKAQESAAE